MQVQASPTIIFAGGLGVPKEVYTRFFHNLNIHLSQLDITTRSFWIAESIYSSSSAIPNPAKLGNEHFASDHSLDILSMLSDFSSEMRPGPVLAVWRVAGARDSSGLNGLVGRYAARGG